MTRLLLIQGANLVWLGKREPEIYGRTSAAELDAMLGEEAKRRNVTLEIRYTNLEGEAIDWIYDAASKGVDGLLMNPAGFTYSGYALRDCLKGVRDSLPYVEVHISMSGPKGSVAAFADLGVKRRVFVHINNSNPVLREGSPERRQVEAAGWEVARDGMDIRL